MKKVRANLGLRKTIMLIISFVHIPLIIAPVYCLIASAFLNWGDISFAPSYAVKFIGILIPVVTSYFAMRYLKNLLFYIIYGLVCTALIFFVLGCPILTVITAFICFIRCYSSFQEDKESVFDAPHWPGCLVYGITYIAGAVAVSPFIQLFSLILLVVYLSLFFLYRGLKRVGDYVEVNSGMANLPGRRILKSGNILYISVTLLVLLLVLPSLIMNFRFVAIDVTGFGIKTNVRMNETPSAPAGQDLEFEALKALAEETEPNPAAELIANIFIVLVCIGALFLLAYGFYKLFRNFSHTEREKADVIEFIEYKDVKERIDRKKQRLRILDFSPNATVRKRFIRAVRRAKKATLQPWHSPRELENEAGVEDLALHNLYEKARYSKDGCTKDEI